ncbi:hypothetical protein [Xanthomonas euvesicatoria]|uniref:hypothetical protein n=1 Tax=Xanthomonas euvesicatoria TaxID=456327 RepID=UPI001E4F08F9|nr:hypothetical protein [Xanthomonas euvesicatoria]
MSARKRERFKGRKSGGAFFRVSVEVLESPAFCGLSMKARGLLLDLGAQFNGYNNGDQSAAWSVMHKRGWKSKDTLRKALLELLDAGCWIDRADPARRPALVFTVCLHLDGH